MIIIVQVREDTMLSKRVLVVKLSLFSTRRYLYVFDIILQAKQTKKLVLRLECKECKAKAQRPLKRCKTLEIGEKKNKDAQTY